MLLGAVALAAQTTPPSAQTPAPTATTKPDLTNPAAFKETAPPTYRVRMATTVGTVVIQVNREWAPFGADRFYNLVKAGFYDECRFYRVIKGFVAQFGIHGNPAVNAAWGRQTLPAERSRRANTRGRVTFAMAQLATTRTTQVFINYGNNSKLDIDGFAPIGDVVTGMALLDLLFNQFGEGPDPIRFLQQGHAFLLQAMPQLDFIKTAVIE